MNSLEMILFTSEISFCGMLGWECRRASLGLSLIYKSLHSLCATKSMRKAFLAHFIPKWEIYIFQIAAELKIWV